MLVRIGADGLFKWRRKRLIQMVSAVRFGRWHPAQQQIIIIERSSNKYFGPKRDDSRQARFLVKLARPLQLKRVTSLITEVADLRTFLAIARKQGFVAIDTETTSLNAAAADLVGVAMALAPGYACYVPLRHGAAQNLAASGQTGLDFDGAQDTAPFKQIPFDDAIKLFRDVFEDPAILKIGHNLKYDSHVLLRPANGRHQIASGG